MSKELRQEQYDDWYNDWWENVGIVQIPHDDDTLKKYVKRVVKQFVKRIASDAWEDGYNLCKMEYVQTMEAAILAEMERVKEIE